MENAYQYFSENIKIIDSSLKTVDKSYFDKLLNHCEEAIKTKKRIIVSGLGKNSSVCDKFVRTMLSMGLDASYLDTGSALHGDVGMVHQGDVVIIVTKSASTYESLQLFENLKTKGINKLWLLTFNPNGILSEKMENKIVVKLENEGDLWNIIPNNSTTINLIILQTLAIKLAQQLNLNIEKDFKPNHPGGIIGERLQNGE